jgi:hypothetical protein
VIDRVPAIDSSSEAGTRPRDIVGKVTFRNIDFSYPARKGVQILDK